jgi:hypothetical protein
LIDVQIYYKINLLILDVNSYSILIDNNTEFKKNWNNIKPLIIY